jgi:hypothetical protein
MMLSARESARSRLADRLAPLLRIEGTLCPAQLHDRPHMRMAPVARMSAEGAPIWRRRTRPC